ncbi:MAG: transposase [Candidatus Gracilibacteria bacterium]|nr:transposase [Candidatus Gracilibacteria bacterium]
MQFLNKGVDEVRRQETKTNILLKNSRFLWLKNPDNLKEKSKLKLEELKKENKILAEAYQIKENVKEFFEKETKEEAELFLKLWCEWVMGTGIEPMMKVVKTVKAHWSGLMNYIDLKINSGLVEGLNSIIQTIKRRARGFRNFENFKTMIYLSIGDFEVSVKIDILPNGFKEEPKNLIETVKGVGYIIK